MFPLLKLPLLAVKNVIRTMDLGEILLFANSCPEARRILRMFIPKNSFQLRLEIKTEPSIVVKYGSEQMESVIPLRRTYLCRMTGYYNEHMLSQLTSAVDGICQKLDCIVSSVMIDCQFFWDKVPEILYWIYTRQVWIDSLEILTGPHLNYLTQAGIEYLFKFSTFIKKDFVLEINEWLPRNVQNVRNVRNVRNVLLPKLGMDYLSVRSNDVVSVFLPVDVPNFNCIHIRLQMAVIRSIDLNEYLKKWIEGCNPRMEYLKLNLMSVEHETIVRGIEWEKHSGSYVRTYKHPKLDEPFTSTGGTNIKRQDGSLATFKLRESVFEMVVWPRTDK